MGIILRYFTQKVAFRAIYVKLTETRPIPIHKIVSESFVFGIIWFTIADARFSPTYTPSFPYSI